MEIERLYSLSEFLSDETISYYKAFSTINLRSVKSKDSYAYLLAGICNFSRQDFLVLIPSTINAYFHQKAKECSINTLRWQISAFRSFSKFIDTELANKGKNPIYYELFSNTGFAFEDLEPEVLDIPTYENVNRVLEYLKAEGDLMLFTAMALALRCSLTSEEICNLRRQQIIVDTSDNYGIHFVKNKEDERFVKLPEDVIKLLVEHIRDIPMASSYLFLNKRGKPITKHYLQVLVRNACLAAGVDSFTMQQLRSLSIGQMLAYGAPTKSLSYYIGIGQEMIYRYNKYVPELENAAVDYSHIFIRW